MSEQKMRNRVSFFSGTIPELFDWCVQNGIDPADVRTNGAHLKYESPETEQEAANAVLWAAQQERRQEQWEAETYARLRAKFEPVGSVTGTGDQPE